MGINAEPLERFISNPMENPGDSHVGRQDSANVIAIRNNESNIWPRVFTAGASQQMGMKVCCSSTGYTAGES
jgi:hypothetical protein